jgi:hypothetical protein
MTRYEMVATVLLLAACGLLGWALYQPKVIFIENAAHEFTELPDSIHLPGKEP